MAKIWETQAPKRKGNPNRIKKEVIQSTQPVNDVKEDDSVIKLMNEMKGRMDKLEFENKELKERVELSTPKAIDKKKNNEPKKFCYKMRAWVPICSYESKSKDPSKGLSYNDGKGNIIDNNLVVLKLSNGETVEVFNNEFGRDYTVSDKFVALDHNNETIHNETLKRVKEYRFDTKEHWTFTISTQCING